MLVNNKEAASRLGSPLNLINRLRNSSTSRNSAMSLFIPPSSSINKEHRPSEASEHEIKPSEAEVETSLEKTQDIILEDLVENSDSKVKLGLAHDSALKLLNDSVALLSSKLDDVKAEKLPSVISSASKVVESIRRERSESAKHGRNQEVHHHFYMPTQKKLNDYEVIDLVPVASQ